MTNKLKSEPATPGSAPTLSKAERRHKRLGWYGCALGIVIGLGGLLLGRLGQLWIAFDVFSQFTPQFAFLTAAFVIGLLIPRIKVLGACLVFAAMVLAYGVWPFWAGHEAGAQAAPAQATPQAIKLASFNTWMANETPELVIKEIARLDADVVTLMEFGPNKAKLLGELKAQYPYQAECTSKPDCNLAILSKFPLTSIEAKPLWVGPPVLRAELGGELTGMQVIAVHTTRFPYARAQFKQIKALAQLVQSLPGRKVVMGDFNATPFSRITQVMANDSGLKRLTDLPSWPSWTGLPQLAIDHVFVSPDIGLAEGERLGNASGSDHFPVTLTISLPAANAGT